MTKVQSITSRAYSGREKQLPKKRIVFFISDTGGGHRAAAQAIAEAIHYLYPDSYDTFIEDIWKFHTPWPINKLPDSYPWLTGPGLPLWKLMWSGSIHLGAYKIVPTTSPFLAPKVIHYLHTIRPDIVVSAHPLMNHLGLKWLRKAKLDIPFVTVVTDLVTIHPLWICPRVTRCIVPTEVAENFAIRLGMPPERVDVCGQPVALKFATTSNDDKQTLRQKLGLDLNRRAVMVVGGGEGFGRVFDIARAIAQTVSQAQLLIIAGRNKALKEKLEAVVWEIPTQIYGFVDNMPEFMRAVDILITKAGPGTISEAFIAGLPLLMFGFIPGQEEGNVSYVQEHRAGVYAETPQEIARLVLNWMDPQNNTLQRMALNAARLAKPKASLTIASKVCSLIEEHRLNNLNHML